MLSTGRVIEQVTHAQLLAMGGYYATAYGQQTSALAPS